MHFHIHKGINQKVEQVEFFENVSPLGNDVLFKMIMKKNESEINWDREVSACAHARPVTYEDIYILHTQNMQVRIFS